VPALTRSVRPYREFGSWLRSRRLARRWTQEELARRLDYDVTYVRKIEWGERRPSEALRVRVAQVLGLPVSGLPPSIPRGPLPGLPDAPGPLLGRDGQVDAVLALFERGERLVTIVGAPGIGKTRLAVAVASKLDGRLPGGARFASLLEVPDGDGIAHPIARALGIVVPAGEGVRSRLVDALAVQKVLLVLDNFDHVMAGADLVGELLAGVPTLRVMATCRQALGLRSETLFVLPPLAVPTGLEGPLEAFADVPSVALFVVSARKVRPDFALSPENVEAVAQICARLQGIPLAIELAAAATRVLDPHALLAQMGHGLELPVEGPRDAPDHHRTLRAAIDWSVARLTALERTLLSRLAVFAGCTLSAAVAVCRLPGEDALDPHGGVLDLVRKSLLEPVPGVPGEARFVALEAVRQLSLEMLSASGDTDRFMRRHAEWALELAELQDDRLTGAGQAEALTALETEHANLRAALGWSVAHAPAITTRLCGALWRYWWMRGHLGEGREWLRLALAAPQSDAAAHARAMTGAGILARAQGAYTVGGESLEQAVPLWRSIGDQGGLALATINLGILAADQADYQRASVLFQESRRLSGGIGDLRGVGHSLNCLGSVRLGQGDLEASSQLFEEALTIFRDVDDDWSTAMVLANLGWVAYKQGRAPVARLLYEKAMAMYRVLGDDRGVASMLLNLGIADDDAADVIGLFEEALLIFFRLGERRSVAECLDSLAVAGAALDPATTAALLAASDTILSAIGAARWPDEQAGHDRTREAVRSELGEAAFELAWEDGRRMRLEEVIALGLGRR
jgi:predicted ATPase